MSAEEDERLLAAHGRALRPPRRDARAAFSREKAPDRRGAEVVAEVTFTGDLDRELRARVVEALEGDGIDLDQADVSAAVALLAGLRGDTNVIQARMVHAGEALLGLQEVAGRRGYRALLAAGLVPFSESQASKLRRIALAVRNGTLSLKSMPRSIEAASIAARLPKEAVEELERRGEINPEATTRGIAAAAQALEEEPPKGRRAKLLARLKGIAERKEAHRRAYRAAMAALDAEAAKLREELKGLRK